MGGTSSSPDTETTEANGVSKTEPPEMLDPREDAYFQTIHRGLINIGTTLGTRRLASMVVESDTICHYDLSSFPGVKGLVAMTIDDVPARQRSRSQNMCREMKDLLYKFGAKATFFLCSDHVAGHERDLIDLLSDGHEVANHCARDCRYDSYSEEDFEQVFLASERVCQDIRRRARNASWRKRPITQVRQTCCSSSCFSFFKRRRKVSNASQLTETAGNTDFSSSSSLSSQTPATSKKQSVRWFRAPHAALSAAMKQVIDRQGFTHVLCDSYANDPWISDADFISSTLLSHADDGSIIVIHMPERGFREYNFEALRCTLEGLQKKGLRSVTLTELHAAAASPTPSIATAADARDRAMLTDYAK